MAANTPIYDMRRRASQKNSGSKIELFNFCKRTMNAIDRMEPINNLPIIFMGGLDLMSHAPIPRINIDKKNQSTKCPE